MKNESKKTAVDYIVGQLITHIETTGKLPWQKPWNVVALKNIATLRPYRGINVLVLSLLGQDNYFLTFNQAVTHGGTIKKGSKSLQVAFFKPFEEEKTLASGAKVKVMKGGFWRYYNVFNFSDSEGTNLTRPKTDNPLADNFTENVQAEEFMVKCGCPIVYSGNRACYSPGLHRIQLPPREQFKAIAEFYKTAFHEITHSLAAESGKKLDSSFGSDEYSKEELVAELGANFIASFCGVDISTHFDNSGEYLRHWLEVIRAEPKILLSAASEAQRRFDLLLVKLGVQNAPEAKEEETAEIEQAA
jgi:antirestriction protein ArdC